jgi:hypothetical protein
VRRTILAFAAVLAATTANAQSSSPWPQSGEGVPLYQRKFMPPDGYASPDQRALVALSAPIVAPTLVEPVIMLGGAGGSIMEHAARFWTLKRSGAPVEMRGGCWSACTLLTSYIPKERLCFAPGSFLAFHSARSVDSPKPELQSTLRMYASYPAEIQRWIDRNGGPHKMTVETFWTMYAPELWAMGYPRCK